ncbi:MAG: acyl-CoA dehydrogenase [Bradyrhizobium sp.]|nr:acyl-CoA dehydrogenase [Bradyrhizobium sp.]
MDLDFGAGFESFRAGVVSFLADHWDPADAPDKAASTDFRRKAVEQGYLYRSIPRQYGGSEQAADPIKARIIKEEFDRRRAPGELKGPGPAMLVPTLLARGTAWQKERFIAPVLYGQAIWCQGYSEPGSGSDLASLRTQAVIDGDEWVITGQKVWTTVAHLSDYMFILVRTDPAAPKHHGISYLLLDMKQPGVTVRPLRQMTGGSEFNEVFLDGARTPRDWIVGAPGEGWSVSKSTLKFERDSIGGSAVTEQLFARLIELARDSARDGRAALDRDDVRQELAKLEAYVLAQKYSLYRQMSMNLAGKSGGLIELLSKLNGTQIGHRAARLAQELLGADGLVMPPERKAPDQGRGNAKWVNQIMGSLGIAIAGGTSNIQRGVIAERGLGLPRDKSMAA